MEAMFYVHHVDLVCLVHHLTSQCGSAYIIEVMQMTSRQHVTPTRRTNEWQKTQLKYEINTVCTMGKKSCCAVAKGGYHYTCCTDTRDRVQNLIASFFRP